MENRIKNVMASVLGFEINDIKNESPNLKEHWDSLKHMNLIVALEEEFDIQFHDDEMSQLINFLQIKEMVLRKINHTS